MSKHIIIGIDDTDDIESKGTGAIASELRTLIERAGFGTCGYVTRHQLLVHPDIKYTSHNSSMVFDADIDEAVLQDAISAVCEHVAKESAPTSDPAVAVLCPDDAADPHTLTAFGFLAKNKVLTRDDAFATAKRCGVFLKALGGDGSGVIGALAGVALRMSGNDGELKGGAKEFLSESSYTVRQIEENAFIDEVRATDGGTPQENDLVFVPWKIKPVLTDGKLVAFVKNDGAGGWTAFCKKENRDMEFARHDIASCEHYKDDVDEERVSNAQNTCLNCIFRRWTHNGFSCEHKKK